MSRTNKGGKPLGWEYWGKRKGGSWVDRETSHKIERMQLKEELREELGDFLSEYYGVHNYVDNPHLKSLFPDANYIEVYHHYVFGYDVLVVAGKHFGELSFVNELLAYAYHTGENYEDYEDLEKKYLDHLDCGNEPWDFLP